MPAEVIVANSLSKEFKKFRAVDNVSFKLFEGEILGLLGANGAGKTTIIQILLGILTPGYGDVRYFDLELKKHRAVILSQINFSSTYTNLPWNLKVSDCLKFIALLYDLPQRKTRIEQVVSEFKLNELWNKRIITLSAGEMTRVNLAKAFINSPRVVLLDEPTASLDPDVAQSVRTMIMQRRASGALSVIFTSHNMREVELMCDRVIFLHNGKLVAEGSPAELAHSVEDCTLSLIVAEQSIERLMQLAQQEALQLQRNGSEFSIVAKELEVPELLAKIVKAQISFHGINLNKPTLEDYFLRSTRIHR